MLEIDENDELFIGDKVLSYFGNCLECGLCCSVFETIELTEMEIQEIADYLQMTTNDFRRTYTKKMRKKGTVTKKSLQTPCPFQQSSRCNIHSKKPFDCKAYPLLINLTKKQAILTGIYLCPQATHFYQGFLDYTKNHFPTLFHKLISLEKKACWVESGLELTIPSEPLSNYIDWVYSKK